MAKEPEGINRTIADIGNFLKTNYQRERAFYDGIEQSVGKVGEFFAGKTPNWNDVKFAPTAPAAPYAGPRGADAAERWTSGTPSTTTVPSRSVPAPGGTGMAGPAAPAVNPIEALFAPMFEQLAQREQQANQRYEANAQQVTNIYGQITGARTADIATTGEAFRRLSDAASARSTAVNTSIDESEAARLRNNQAALESMGIGGLSTSQGDIASQGAAMAKNTNQLNAENWQGLLTAMGANAQDIARSDVAGFNYRMGEDLGQLRGSREEFLQGLEQERMGLVGQQAQATFEFQQAQQAAAAAANAAAQRAAADSADSASKQFAEALKASGPLLYTVSQLTGTGALTTAEGTNVMNVITEWSQNVPPQGNQGWKASTAANSILSAAGTTLSPAERQAIIAVTSNMFPQG
jgi:hypothetical protein